MKITEIKSLSIPAIKVVRFARFVDFRGYFTEPFRKSDFSAQLEFMKGVEFFQFNESFSRSNVLRGLHFQWNPLMGKLVRTVQGRMVDLFLDIRKGSPTYGKAAAYDIPSWEGPHCLRSLAHVARGRIASAPVRVAGRTGYAPTCSNDCMAPDRRSL
jgi:dTDP-4-dehydrorhamnose 3,5-epimerase-like enzyme